MTVFFLEGREPFLDQHIIEFTGPGCLCTTNWSKECYILREIVHKYIPAQMMERAEDGIWNSTATWLEGEDCGILLMKHLIRFVQQQALQGGNNE